MTDELEELGGADLGQGRSLQGEARESARRDVMKWQERIRRAVRAGRYVAVVYAKDLSRPVEVGRAAALVATGLLALWVLAFASDLGALLRGAEAQTIAWAPALLLATAALTAGAWTVAICGCDGRETSADARSII